MLTESNVRVMELGYPKSNFNVPELVWGNFEEIPPLAPLLAGFAEKLISEAGEPDVVVRYVDVRNDLQNATLSDEYGMMIYMPPGPNQCCVVDMFKNIYDEEGNIDDSLHDYFQIQYSEIPLRLEHHMAGAVANGKFLPFVSQVNNVQLEEWFRENSVESYSRYNYDLSRHAVEISEKAPWVGVEE